VARQGHLIAWLLIFQWINYLEWVIHDRYGLLSIKGMTIVLIWLCVRHKPDDSGKARSFQIMLNIEEGWVCCVTIARNTDYLTLNKHRASPELLVSGKH
jgi:hypothetical protein